MATLRELELKLVGGIPREIVARLPFTRRSSRCHWKYRLNQPREGRQEKWRETEEKQQPLASPWGDTESGENEHPGSLDRPSTETLLPPPRVQGQRPPLTHPLDPPNNFSLLPIDFSTRVIFFLARYTTGSTRQERDLGSLRDARAQFHLVIDFSREGDIVHPSTRI